MSKLPWPLPCLPDCLEALIRQVPRGRVTTYGTLAEGLGDRIAARWVGQFLLGEAGARLAVHRIVRADGSLGGYGGELWRKRYRLQLEGHDRFAEAQGSLDLG